jgi:hypothetical protein
MHPRKTAPERGVGFIDINMKFVSVSPDAKMLKPLQRCGLPVSATDSSDSLLFYGRRGNGKSTGVVGLQVHGTVAPMRSLTVCSIVRSSRLGYMHHQRDHASESVKKTAQFSGLCPASSGFMSKDLPGQAVAKVLYVPFGALLRANELIGSGVRR